MYDRKTSDWRGLSPLARGTPILEFVIWTPMRFIPAGAGNSAPFTHHCSTVPVYPRWRGELCHWFHAGRAKIGLSPLARGTPIHILINHQNKRFIPAGAGNSQYHYIKECRIPVYPRWRGELGAVFTVHCANLGLSPLARGTHILIGIHELRPRFIPAGAGNSFSSSSIAVVLTVYPRWRGELLIRSSYSAPLAGLSPLTRGTQHGRPYEIPVARFIPAGAGNSHPSRNNAFIFPVYPRWRGEL